MSTKRFLGQAGAVIQIDKIALGGTFAAGEHVSVQIGHSTLAVLLGTGQTTPAIVATVICNAINAGAIGVNLQGAETRLNAGQLLGEFRDVNAIIDPASTSNVLVRSNIAGVPFGTPNSGGPINAMVVTTDSGSGTMVRSSIQAATGPWHWNNADNWDSGSVPVNGDKTQFKGINIPVKYGLPNGALEVVFDQYMSHTGDIGLAEINTDNSGAPYYEYRQRWVRLAHSSLANATHNFGIGNDGAGSQLINLKHTGGTCTVTVFNTGNPKATGSKALNICCTDNTSTLYILKGSVDFSSQDGSTTAFAIVTQGSGDSRGVGGLAALGAVTQLGGTMLLGGTLAMSVISKGGTVRIEGQSGSLTSLDIYNGAIVDLASALTITALQMFGATLDLRSNTGAVTITNATLITGQNKILDPGHRATFTNPAFVQYDLADLQLGVSSLNPLLITF